MRFRELLHRAVPAVWGIVALCTAGGLQAAAGDEATRNLVLQPAPTPARSQQRVALVIGNAAYKEAPLSNPVNDARAMAQALQAAGFTVMLHTDIDHRGLITAVRDFGNRLRQGGGVGLFYYAGHGMQIKGRNYLIPIGANIQREDEVAYAALDAQAVLDKMEAASNGTNLMILDACRNNPFARSFRSSAQGLAQMEAPVGTLVAFSTAPGSVASDGQGAHGLYTQHLLAAMRTPGAKVEDVFKKVRAGVRRDSQGKQIPWEATSLEGDLYFIEPKPTEPAAVATAPATAPAAPPAPSVPSATTAAAATAAASAAPQAAALRRAEELYWAVVKDSRNADELQTYLRAYPQGQFVALARARLAALSAEVAAAAPAATTAQKPPPAPAPASAAQGFAVGDIWTYRVSDKLKGNAAQQYSVKVAKVNQDGSWVSSSGSDYDALGRAKRWTDGTGQRRQMLPHGPGWWADMKVGQRQAFEWLNSGQRPDGTSWANRTDSDAEVVGVETITVPAGQFKALHIIHKGTETPIAGPGYGTFRIDYWYVPELRTLVAVDDEWRWNGALSSITRLELISYGLAKPPAAR